MANTTQDLASAPTGETPFVAALAALRANRPDAAHQLLQTAVKLDPAHFQAWLLLGWTAPTPAAALDYFKQALVLEPDNPLAADGLNWAAELTSKIETQTPPALNAAIAEITNPPLADLEAANASNAAVARPRFSKLQVNENLVAPFGYLAALILAEGITTLVSPVIGLGLHIVLFIALIIHASFRGRGPQQRFVLSLSLAPLIRILSLAVPLAQFPPTFWPLVVGLPLMVAVFLTARTIGFGGRKMGLTVRGLPVQLVVGLSGIGLGYVEYLILRPPRLIESLTWEQLWLPALILMVFGGFVEELIFRGLIQRTAVESLGRFGIPYVAVLFAAWHLGYALPLELVFAFGVGLLFSLIVARTGSLLGVSIAHGLINVVLFLIFPFWLG
ncbi:MAG: CPBP family intramembrane metalloprotease [Chloroflexi bacterium]|nr:CPBP family intramembrane metalloprotease [Chloroflexota bacterium]